MWRVDATSDFNPAGETWHVSVRRLFQRWRTIDPPPAVSLWSIRFWGAPGENLTLLPVLCWPFPSRFLIS